MKIRVENKKKKTRKKSKKQFWLEVFSNQISIFDLKIKKVEPYPIVRPLKNNNAKLKFKESNVYKDSERIALLNKLEKKNYYDLDFREIFILNDVVEANVGYQRLPDMFTLIQTVGTKIIIQSLETYDKSKDLGFYSYCIDKGCCINEWRKEMCMDYKKYESIFF